MSCIRGTQRQVRVEQPPESCRLSRRTAGRTCPCQRCITHKSCAMLPPKEPHISHTQTNMVIATKYLPYAAPSVRWLFVWGRPDGGVCGGTRRAEPGVAAVYYTLYPWPTWEDIIKYIFRLHIALCLLSLPRWRGKISNGYPSRAPPEFYYQRSEFDRTGNVMSFGTEHVFTFFLAALFPCE